MITLMLTVTAVFALLNVSSTNPVKIMLILLGISSSSFVICYWLGVMSAFVIILYILFVGGILIIFIILASLLPNEKSIKSRTIPIIAGISIITWLLRESFKSVTRETVKSAFFSIQIVTMAVILVLIYFFSFLYVLSRQDQPMRFFLCREMKFL